MRQQPTSPAVAQLTPGVPFPVLQAFSMSACIVALAFS
jgi:hypothetical protein